MYQFPFPLDDFQLAASKIINDDKDILVSAPTGSGKTVIAEMVIMKAIGRQQRVIYTSPIKALSNQKFDQFKKQFSASTSIGLMTGDIVINPKAALLIMTTEILRNILIFSTNNIGEVDSDLESYDNSILDCVDSIILDEIHYYSG